MPRRAEPSNDAPEEAVPILHSDDGTPRTHLEDYLEFYVTLENPGYAVLVTGAWGTGKTFQVKNCVPEDERHYVSLFGLQTVEQLHAEVLASVFPTLDKARKLVERASDTAKDVGGIVALAGAVPVVFSALLRRDVKPEHTLIFDDLERSQLALKDLLGAINFYVEQRGFRVVVIAHDEKLADEFLAMKEKTFGQVIRVAPQVEDAFESFVEQISSAPARAFVRSHRDTILDTFAQSGEESLRVLKHLTEDLERVYRALSQLHLAHDDAMRHLVALFSAFDTETRAGRLGADDLKDRREKLYAGALGPNTQSEDAEKPPLVKADEKYPAIDLDGGMLSDDLLTAMFIHGRYDPSQIRASLDNSAFFVEPANVPPWKIVINFDESEDDVVDEGLRRMDAQFDNRDVTNSGEMLHIFALRLMMADHGISGRSLEEETVACQRYVDDLLAAGRLPPRETDDRWWDSFDRSHDGHGYWITEAAEPHFKTLWDHLVAARQQAFEQQFPAIAERLLELMKSDAKALFEMISPTNNGDNPYAYIPVLHAIKPGDFVDTWLAAPREHWRTIRSALQNCYAGARLERELCDESAWAKAVHDLLLERADNASGLSALRIRRIIPKALGELAASDGGTSDAESAAAE